MRARPRSCADAGSGDLKPLSAQPSAVRVPLPSTAQVVPPSVERSKATSSASGKLPPRSHSTPFDPVGSRFCVMGSFSSLATLLTLAPPTLLMSPAMMILPSSSTMMLFTMPVLGWLVLMSVPITSALKSSTMPSASRRAKPRRAMPRIVVKPPPMSSLPSACKAMLFTASFAVVVNSLSSVPFAFSLASLARETLLIVLKLPPMRMCPSG